MNKVAILIIFAFFTSCTSASRRKDSASINKENMKNYSKQLIETGFLKFVEPKTYDSIAIAFTKDLDIYDSSLCRYTHIDAEELSEGNFDFFMPILFNMISQRGVNISINKAIDFDTSYSVNINGKELKLFDQDDLEDYSFWDLAPNRFFNELNNHLERQKTRDRFYLIYGGNDLGVFLITPEQFNIIMKMYSNSPKDMPYEPKKL